MKTGFFVVDSDSESIQTGKCDVKCEMCEGTSDNCTSCVYG